MIGFTLPLYALLGVELLLATGLMLPLPASRPGKIYTAVQAVSLVVKCGRHLLTPSMDLRKEAKQVALAV